MKINIYLSEEHKEKLNTISNKYRLSMSTIADILICTTYYVYLHYSKNKVENEKILKEYIIKEGLKKTSIKPKSYKNESLYNKAIENKSIFTTNSLIIYLDRLANKYFDEKQPWVLAKEDTKECNKVLLTSGDSINLL